MAAATKAHHAGLLALGLLAGTALTPPVLAQAPAATQAGATNFADLVARVAPAVVRVSTVGQGQVQAAEIPPRATRHAARGVLPALR